MYIVWFGLVWFGFYWFLVVGLVSFLFCLAAAALDAAPFGVSVGCGSSFYRSLDSLPRF